MAIFARKIKMNRKILLAAAVLGATGIVLGAFGAHALKKVLGEDSLLIFETGVRYQMYHALFLLFVGVSALPEKAKKTIMYLTVIGLLFFSGSLYLLATDSLNSFDFKVFGPVTPVGGFLLILAWTWLFVGIMRKKL